MSWHQHPVLVCLEAVREAAGLQQAQNTVAVDELEARYLAGTVYFPIPVAYKWYIGGVVYDTTEFTGLP